MSRVREKAKCSIIIVDEEGWPSKASTSNDRVLWGVKSVLVLVIAACKGSLILDKKVICKLYFHNYLNISN